MQNLQTMLTTDSFHFQLWLWLQQHFFFLLLLHDHENSKTMMKNKHNEIHFEISTENWIVAFVVEDFYAYALSTFTDETPDVDLHVKMSFDCIVFIDFFFVFVISSNSTFFRFNIIQRPSFKNKFYNWFKCMNDIWLLWYRTKI